MKKTTAILLCALMVISLLASCGKKSSDGKKTSEGNKASAGDAKHTETGTPQTAKAAEASYTVRFGSDFSPLSYNPNSLVFDEKNYSNLVFDDEYIYAGLTDSHDLFRIKYDGTSADVGEVSLESRDDLDLNGGFLYEGYIYLTQLDNVVRINPKTNEVETIISKRIIEDNAGIKIDMHGGYTFHVDAIFAYDGHVFTAGRTGPNGDDTLYYVCTYNVDTGKILVLNSQGSKYTGWPMVYFTLMDGKVYFVVRTQISIDFNVYQYAFRFIEVNMDGVRASEDGQSPTTGMLNSLASVSSRSYGSKMFPCIFTPGGVLVMDNSGYSDHDAVFKYATLGENGNANSEKVGRVSPKSTYDENSDEMLLTIETTRWLLEDNLFLFDRRATTEDGLYPVKVYKHFNLSSVKTVGYIQNTPYMGVYKDKIYFLVFDDAGGQLISIDSEGEMKTIPFSFDNPAK